MWKKCIVIALGIFAFGADYVPRANAGTETLIDNSAQTPAPAPAPEPVPRYYYLPPPRPVYYAPPLIGVAVYPGYRYYGPRFGGFGSYRAYGRRVYWGHRRWR